MLLCLPAVLLLRFGLLLPDGPVLQVRSVRFPPVIRSETKRNYKDWKAIEVFVDYNPPLMARFKPQPVLSLDFDSGSYIEDEWGVKYGKSSSAPDKNSWRPIGFYVRDLSPMDTRWVVEIGKIPKSAGKLTFKAVLNLGSREAKEASAQLPLSIVVRE